MTIDGLLACWGGDVDGVRRSEGRALSRKYPYSPQFPTPPFSSYGQAVSLVPRRGGFVHVSAGYYVTCALLKTGVGICWGGESAHRNPRLSACFTTVEEDDDSDHRYCSQFSARSSAVEVALSFSRRGSFSGCAATSRGTYNCFDNCPHGICHGVAARQCRSGAAGVGGACATCPPGRFSLGGAPVCAPCVAPAGAACAAGATSPSGDKCAQGYFCVGGATPAALCAVLGYYCGDRAMSPTATPCAPGHFGGAPGQLAPNCSGVCTGVAGRYCPAASPSSRGALCPPGFACSGGAAPPFACTAPSGFFCGAGGAVVGGAPCPRGATCAGGAAQPSGCWAVPGEYCVGGVGAPTPCPGGVFGNASGLRTSECSGGCAPGFFCPPGSVDGAAPGSVCPGAAVFCPPRSAAPHDVFVGAYSDPPGGVGAVRQRPCPVGSYCAGGVRSPCPPGRFGDQPVETSPLCSGPCAPGYYCGPGSVSRDAAPCGPPSLYCPESSGAPRPVPPGHYSVASAAAVPCEAGRYCVNGSAAECGAGRYGDSRGLASLACSGVCDDGWLCGAGSTSATAAPCPLGSYCAGGRVVACPAGTYRDGASSGGDGASKRRLISFAAPPTSADACTLCPAGTASAVVGAPSAGACAPCAAREASPPGALACWPGVVSVVASNPPPVVPGLTPGDVVTITFSKPTNAPPLPDAASLAATLGLSFSAVVGASLRGVWSADGAALAIVILDTAGSSATAIGQLTLSLYAWPVQDAVRAAPPPTRAPGSLTAWPVTGDWGVAAAPGFLRGGAPGDPPPALALNSGGGVGMGAGDSLVLRFSTPVAPVPLDSKAAVDAVFSFSAPIGLDYSGAWEASGRFAGAAVTLTVMRGLPPGADLSDAAVGALRVGLRALVSAGGVPAGANESVVVAAGSWGDGAALALASASHVRARLAFVYAARGLVAANVTCGEGAAPAAGDAARPHVYSRVLPLEPAAATGAPGSRVVFVGGFAPLAAVWCAVVLHSEFGAGEGLVAVAGPPVLAAATLTLPSLASVTLLGGRSLLSTFGGESVTLAGAGLGFGGSSAVVTARYWAPARGAAYAYALRDCATSGGGDGSGGGGVVTCVSAPGAGGSGFVWAVALDGGESEALPAAVRYNAPVIIDVSIVGRVATVDGRELGPAGGAYVGRVWMTLASNASVVFEVPGCTVVDAHVTMECPLPGGEGASLYWTLEVGGQASGRPSTSYEPPVISSVACAPSPCGALSTLPGVDVVTMRASGLGTATAGPAGESVVGGGFGGAALVVSGGGGGSSLPLLGCAVVTPGLDAVVCRSPGGVGGGFGLRLTVLGQVSAPAPVVLAFAAPVILNATGGPLRVRDTVLVVHGRNLGGAGVLALAGVAVPAFGTPNADHTAMTFAVAALPPGAVGAPSVGAVVTIGGVPSNALRVPVAPPSFVTDTQPVALLDAPPPGCAPAAPGAIWLLLSGLNFGWDARLVAVTVAGGGGGDGVPCAVCNVSDAALSCSTTAPAGALVVAVGALASPPVAYSFAQLSQAPVVLTATLGDSRPLVGLSTAGGDVATLRGTGFTGFNRQATSAAVVLVRGGGAGGEPTLATLTAAPRCAVLNASETALTCVVPPGTGTGLAFVVLAHGRGTPAAGAPSVSFAPPVITGVGRGAGVDAAGAGGPLPVQGGPITLFGANFGGGLGPVTVTVGGKPCAVDPGSVSHSRLSCVAPPGTDAAAGVSAVVDGQVSVADGPGIAARVAYARPSLARVVPPTAPTAGGTTLVLYGTDLAQADGAACPTVSFVLPPPLAAVPAPVISCNDTAVVVTAPAGASGDAPGARVDVRLATPGQPTVTAPGVFAYAAPLVTGVRARGAAGYALGGFDLEVAGVNFASYAPVVLLLPPGAGAAGVPCAVLAADTGAITCRVPPGMSALMHIGVAVTVFGRTATLHDAFSFDPPRAVRLAPSRVDPRAPVNLLVWGANMGAMGLALSMGVVPCTVPVHLYNDSVVGCGAALPGRIGVVPVVVSVGGQASNALSVVAACVEGSYGVPGDAACWPCPPHAHCPGAAMDPLPLAGYYRTRRSVFQVRRHACLRACLLGCVCVCVCVCVREGVGARAQGGGRGPSRRLVRRPRPASPRRARRPTCVRCTCASCSACRSPPAAWMRRSP